MDVQLRRAAEEDMEWIKECIDRFRLDPENLDARQFTIAEMVGKRVGFGRIKPYRSTFELSSVAVLEDWRRRGIGTCIVEHLAENFPIPEVWIATDLVEYFSGLGFAATDRGPAEIQEKIFRICDSLRKGVRIMMKRR